jgi:NAD(P)-dependent dehydrogenase (short-subunit alcohol dehydrogenase family)
MDSLRDRTAFVTGAASGIGAAVAEALLAEGAALVLLDRDADGLERWAKAPDVRCLVVDLADRHAIIAAAETALAAGPVDILVNAAGITGAGASLIDPAEEDWDLVHAVNCTAPFLLIRAIGRSMAQRGQGGRIVNITSSSAHRAVMSKPAYGASKAALAQLTRIAAAELGPYDINVNAVAPGLTRTPIVARAFPADRLEAALREGPLANLLHRASEPEDVAATVLFLCQPASRQITGQTIHVSAGAIV